METKYEIKSISISNKKGRNDIYPEVNVFTNVVAEDLVIGEKSIFGFEKELSKETIKALKIILIETNKKINVALEGKILKNKIIKKDGNKKSNKKEIKKNKKKDERRNNY